MCLTGVVNAVQLAAVRSMILYTRRSDDSGATAQKVNGDIRKSASPGLPSRADRHLGFRDPEGTTDRALISTQ